MKRPMFFWVILFVLGEVLVRLLPTGISGFLAVVFFVGVSFKKMPGKVRKLYLVGGCFLLFGMAGRVNEERKILFAEGLLDRQVSYAGRITGFEETKSGYRYVIRTSYVGEKRIHIRLETEVDSGCRIFLGSRVYGNGRAEAFSRASNPGEYDEEDYQYGKGIYLLLKEGRCSSGEKSVLPLRERLYRLRQYFSGVYGELFDEREASVARAMVLGDKSGLDADIRQLYQRNGIAHLIAISGLHLAMLGGTLYHFLRKRLGSYFAAAAVGTVFILLYGMMTGWSGATLRAVVMLILSMGAEVGGRRYDTLTAVSAALLLMLAVNPCQINQPGFLLSFGAILGIAVVNPVWKILYPNIPERLNGLLVSVSVQIVLTPVLLYYFYEIPIYGVVLNVLVVPLMGILLPLLLGCALLAGIWQTGAVLLAAPAKGIFLLYEMLCRAGEQLPGHTLCTGRPGMPWMVCYYGIILIWLVAAYRRKKGIPMFSCILLLTLFLAFRLPGNLRVTLFDVGQGDGIYLKTVHGGHILVDGGSSSRRSVGKYVLKNGIKYYGGAALDYVFISHSDSDHYSGIEELLEDDAVVIRNVVLPVTVNPDEAYRKLELLAKRKGSRVRYMKAGDELIFDGITFSCLSPEERAYADKNQGSMVLQAAYKEFTMLFTGDADETVEQELLKKITEPVEVLKVAHHGSATASSESFLAGVRPAVSCVSVGEENRYGHPADCVMERLERFSGRIYLTKEEGAITIETDGYSYRVRTFAGRENQS
ncbi:MAG: DNA internalization-related competence protein ComEC/Rec2 [Bacteroidales bacterium]|nr:DNA internalization-related competence protein ComEC/Rec2 [Clostridium sp.]MCM1202567.1 DNA internalization-related competence protein ComEC/Rec2 [Bacteroidales bacterium]